MDKCLYSMFIYILVLNWNYYQSPGYFPLYLQEKKNIPLEINGLIFSSQTFIGIFTSIWAAYYTKYYDRNKLIYLSICACGISNICFTFLEFTNNTLIAIIISFSLRLLNGFGFALGGQVIYSYVPILYKDNQVYIFGVVESAASIGQIIGASTGALLYEAGGLMLPFISIGVLQLITLPLAKLYFPQHKVRDFSNTKKDIRLRDIINRQTFGLTLTCIMLFITENIYDATMSIELKRKYRLSEKYAGGIFSLISLSMLAGIQFLNYLTKKFEIKHEWLIFIGIIIPAFGIGCFGNLLFFMEIDNFNLIFLGVFMVGFFEGFYIVLFTPTLMRKIQNIKTYSDETAGDFANGVFQMSYLIGFTIGPSLGTQLTSHYDFNFSTYVCMYSQIVMAVLYFIVFSDIVFKKKYTTILFSDYNGVLNKTGKQTLISA